LFLCFYKRLEALVQDNSCNVAPEFNPRSIRLDSPKYLEHDLRQTNEENNMNNYIRLVAAALCLGMSLLLAPISSAQTQAAKLQAISQQLNLTPEQKGKVLPILADEGPKVQKIKNDNSLSKIQKIQQIKAVHQQTDPQMKAILSPEQYQKLQGIRRQALRDATQTYR
jgi:Spy/CpxP family protein refolding chaperone